MRERRPTRYHALSSSSKYETHLSEDLVRPASVVANAGDRVADIAALRPVEGLPVIEGLEGGKDILALLHEVGELVQEARTIDTGRVQTPGGLKRLVGGFDGKVNILWGTLRNTGSGLAIRRVDDTTP